MRVLSQNGASNIYQIRKKICEELGVNVNYGSVYRCLKRMEENRTVEHIRGKKRKAKVYYLTEDGLTIALTRRYIDYEKWLERFIEYTFLHTRRNMYKLLRFAKKSSIISALLKILKDNKETSRLKQIFYLFTIGFNKWEMERFFDTLSGAEKSSDYYTKRLNEIVTAEIFSEVFPTLANEDKIKFLNLIAKEDLSSLLNILEENKNTCKKMMEAFKQMYETYKKLESELKNLTQSKG